MESIIIEGGHSLQGSVKVQGSKNAALPILAATLLIKGKTVLHNCPHITDIEHMLNLLESIGCVTFWQGDELVIDASDIKGITLPKEDVDCMRSSIMLLGPVLHRVGEIILHYPGGCVIGKRPVDVHIWALQKMGVRFIEENQFIHAASDVLRGADIRLPINSVGVTENLILSAVLAKGRTRIYPAAKEPEVVELCSFLQSAGARIEGAGSDEIIIDGVETLAETEYHIVSDRIVAGTYLFAALGCGGDVILQDAPVGHLYTVLKILKKLGAQIEIDLQEKSIRLNADGTINNLPYLETEVYPGFPTDLQSNLITVLCRAEGINVVKESIFENRFRILPELIKMGADIIRCDNQVIVSGVAKLKGSEVKAMELRGGAALVCAGLIADGMTRVIGTEFIRRGYENIVDDLKKLGATVEWE